MYQQLDLARDRSRRQLEEASRARAGHRMAELRRAGKQEQRAERRLLRAWQRAEDVRSALEMGL